MRIEDTGLALARGDKVVLLQMTTRPRTSEEKQAICRLLATYLAANCCVDPRALVVSLVESRDADWSSGLGEAQFLSGRLA